MKQSMPPPLPKSRTISPAFSEDKAVGLPHPSPKLASSSLASSSAEYPAFLATSADEQQLPVTQHEVLDNAIFP